MPFIAVASPKRTDSLESLLIGIAASFAGSAAIVCGGILVLRRLSGAIVAIPGPFGCFAVCAAGIVLIAVTDGASRNVSSTIGSVLGSIASRVGLVLALVATSLPFGTETLGDRAGVALAAICASVAIVHPLVGRAIGTVVQLQRYLAPVKKKSRLRSAARGSAARGTVEILPIQSDRDDRTDHILQRLERYETADGVDCLRSRLCLTVPAGMRTAYGHIGFCPPFAETPSVVLTTDYDGVEAMLSAAEVLPWGVRVECRLDEPAEEEFEIPIDIFVRMPS